MRPERVGVHGVLVGRPPRLGGLLLVLLLPLLMAQASWTEDKGEAGTADDKLALGVDVAEQVGPPAGAAKTGPALEARTSELSSRLRCPSCQSHSINDSPSESARNMKRQVRAMVAAGYDQQQVLDYFESAYGEFVLMMPKAEGFNVAVWIAPGLLLLVGFGVVVWTLRRERSSEAKPGLGWGDEVPEPEDADLAPYLDRVRQELNQDG